MQQVQPHRRRARRLRPARPDAARTAARSSTRCGARSRRPGRPKKCAASVRRRSTRSAAALAVFEQTLWDARAALPARRSIARWRRHRAAACRSTPRRSASARGLAAIATATRRHAGGDAPRLPGSRVDGADLYARDVDALRRELSMRDGERRAARTHAGGAASRTARCCARCSAASRRRGAPIEDQLLDAARRPRAARPGAESTAPPRTSPSRCALLRLAARDRQRRDRRRSPGRRAAARGRASA